MTHVFVALQAATQPTVEDRSTEFVAVQGGQDTTSAGTLLVAAYALMWVALMAFVFLTWRRQKLLEEKLATLSGVVEKSADRAQPPS